MKKYNKYKRIHGEMPTIRPTGKVVTVVYAEHIDDNGRVYHALHINAEPLLRCGEIDIDSVVRCASGYGITMESIVSIY